VQIHLQILAKTRYSRSTTRWREDGAGSVYHMLISLGSLPEDTNGNQALFSTHGQALSPVVAGHEPHIRGARTAPSLGRRLQRLREEQPVCWSQAEAVLNCGACSCSLSVLGRIMLIARQGEEIVCPKGTLCGRIVRDAEDRITANDFSTAESGAAPTSDRYVCGCCGRIVAVREHQRWRVHLRRGWVR
jgi:hypothetical protein